MPGVETRLPLLFSEGVNKGRIDLGTFVALTATNPAKLYGLYPRKGTIAVGADADLVIWDKDREVVITNDKLHHNCDYTPYEGLSVRGWPAVVLSRGEVVVEEGKLLAQPGPGPVPPLRPPRAPNKAPLLRWRPRPRAQRTRDTPRVRPSGAASQLDLSRPPGAACSADGAKMRGSTEGQPARYGCVAIQCRAMSMRRQIQTRSCLLRRGRGSARAPAQPARAGRRAAQCRPTDIIFGALGALGVEHVEGVAEVREEVVAAC